MPLTIPITATLEWRTLTLDSDAVGSEACGSAGSDCCEAGSGEEIDFEIIEPGVCWPQVCPAIPNKICIKLAHVDIPGGFVYTEGIYSAENLGWFFTWSDGTNSISGYLKCTNNFGNTCNEETGWCDKIGFNGSANFGIGIAYHCCIFQNQTTELFCCEPLYFVVQLSAGVTITAYVPQPTCNAEPEPCSGAQTFWCVDGACVPSETEPEGATAGPFFSLNSCNGLCGGPVALDCCPGADLPATIRAIVTGGCEGEYFLVWDGTAWRGNFGFGVTVGVGCTLGEGGTAVWTLQVNFDMTQLDAGACPNPFPLNTNGEFVTSSCGAITVLLVEI